MILLGVCMNSSISVRQAVVSDASKVYDLLKIIGKLHRDGRPDMFPDLVSKYDPSQVAERLSETENGVFVAVVEEKVVGYVFSEIIAEGNGKTLYVDDLCVDPEYRRMGIAKALMDRASEYGRESDCVFLMLNVWEFNESAVRFYEKYGLETRSRHLEMKL